MHAEPLDMHIAVLHIATARHTLKTEVLLHKYI